MVGELVEEGHWLWEVVAGAVMLRQVVVVGALGDSLSVQLVEALVGVVEVVLEVAVVLALGEHQEQILGHWQLVEDQEVEALHPEVCLLLVALL